MVFQGEMRYNCSIKRCPRAATTAGDMSLRYKGARTMNDSTTPLKRCTSGGNCLHPSGPELPATTDYFYAESKNTSGLASKCRLCLQAGNKQLRDYYGAVAAGGTEENRPQRKFVRPPKLTPDMMRQVNVWRKELNWALPRIVQEVKAEFGIDVSVSTISRIVGNRDGISFGIVYVLRADNGLCKIGYTNNLEQRLYSFNIVLPYELEIVFAVEVFNPTKVEDKLHRYLKHQHIKGEWFSLDDDDVGYIGKYLSEVEKKAE